MNQSFPSTAAVLAALSLASTAGAPARADGPAPVPDARVLVTSIELGNGGPRATLSRLDPDGGQLTVIAKSDSAEFDAVSSPNGKQIAFAHAVIGGEFSSDLCVMNADGSNRHTVTHLKGAVLSPAWSQDGTKIFFSLVEAAQDKVQAQIYVTDPDGKSVTRLHEGLGAAPSPDGKRLLYTTIEQGPEQPHLAVMDIDGSNAKQLSPEKAMFGSWSPDGTEIVYSGMDGALPRLFRMKADGTIARKLPGESAGAEFAARWTPDGKHLLFNVAGSERQVSVYSSDPDGGNRKQLTHGGMQFLSGGSWLMAVQRTQAK